MRWLIRAYCFKKAGLFFQSIYMLLGYKMLAADWNATGDCGCCCVMWEKESKLTEDNDSARCDGGDSLQVSAVSAPPSPPEQAAGHHLITQGLFLGACSLALFWLSFLSTLLSSCCSYQMAGCIAPGSRRWVSLLPQSGLFWFFSCLFPSFLSWSPALQDR